MLKVRKKWLIISTITFIVLAVMFVMLLWFIHSRVITAGQGRIYTLDQEIPHRKVALVLGARVYKNGQLSPLLRDRVDAAIQLYREGTVEKLLMSGDNRTEKYNEVTAMRNYAIEAGIPSDDIVRDFAGFRTYDSIYRAKELWDLEEMIIVSQRFHLPRALYIAKHLGINAIGVAARHDPHRGLRTAAKREIAARLLAWLDVLLGRDPYFLGPKESLSGDAQRPRVGE